MAFYEINLGVLVLINFFLFFQQRPTRYSPPEDDSSETDDEIERASEDKANPDADRRNAFTRAYLTAYLLATAGDWLQAGSPSRAAGPHIYAIYRYDKNLQETTTAALYATGFISGAVSATFVGQLADKYGRKTACLIYCFSYLACCMTMLSNNLTILFIGRVFGGISTTILYSAFETWMITEYHHRGLEAAGLSTATIFGRQTTFNSIVAIFMGVIGELLVTYTGTRKSPFLLASAVFATAAFCIATTWTENYGNTDDGRSKTSLSEIASAAKTIWNDKRVFALAIASSVFEAMMYLFVFFWSAAIKSARSIAGVDVDPPFGLIFACFMCAMMAGSLLFTMFSGKHNVFSTSYVLKIAMTFASLALMSTIINYKEDLVFWAFCIVELCVGLYFPSMNFLKGTIIEDGSRGKIYSLMRLPLNAFVVVAHSLAEEGDHHRNNVFLNFGGGLLVAFIVVQRFIE
ncbi:hypothetical protein CAC42_8200 [Sphaceloma murrayae]|uniref:Molybdate-anion transporter n=1 Tax=Sphaceloma murrayae TaxID=2082308 RepID=A0A2K1QJX9_9PEZI|nr:hypothetical protein CAC42_8200 [Sphaceloma murrayae]